MGRPRSGCRRLDEVNRARQRGSAPAVRDTASFEDEFHRHLGRLVHGAARFDFNVGLQLNWLGIHCGVDVSKHLDPSRVSLGARLDKLQTLVGQAFKAAGPEAMAEFDAWFSRARSARALRNNYAHGRWAAPGKQAESPHGPGHPRVPMLGFVGLDWNLTPDQPDRSVYITMEDFSAQVDDAVAVFNQFFQLTEKHLAFVRPS